MGSTSTIVELTVIDEAVAGVGDGTGSMVGEPSSGKLYSSVTNAMEILSVTGNKLIQLYPQIISSTIAIRLNLIPVSKEGLVLLAATSNASLATGIATMIIARLAVGTGWNTGYKSTIRMNNPRQFHEVLERLLINRNIAIGRNK